MLENLQNILKDNASNERSLYSALEKVFSTILNKYFKKSTNSFQIIPEMSFGKGNINNKNKIKSFPDLTFQFKSHNSFYNIGWIEVKLPGDSLQSSNHKNQFTKYKENLENLIFTNLQQWQLWQWDKDGKSQLTLEINFDITKFQDENQIKKFAQEFLSKFFEYRQLKEIKTASNLAFVLGRKTRILREALIENVDDKTFQNLKNDLNKTLLLDSGTLETREREFNSLLAETLTYSLFTAYLQAPQNARDQFEIGNIQRFIPKNIPILKDLFELIFKTPAIEDTRSSLRLAIDDIIENLKRSSFDRIQNELQNNEFGDPLIYFYEPFLENYDNEIKKDRGAFYTPKPVVDFMVKSVNFLLRTHFQKSEGLADKTVTSLDPFTGTATFLLSQIDFILAQKRQEIQQSFNNPELITRELQNIVNNHILQNLYAFEIMAGPYTIAHLKLTLRLNQDNLIIPKDKRFKIFLTNTFLDPDQQVAEDVFNYFPSIPAESTEAQRIKKEQKIWVVLGNPPYNVKSQNPSKIGKNTTFAGTLIEDFKFTTKGELFGTETRTPLDDDYIKSLGFAFWKIKQAGQGIVAFITNNSFLSGPTHRKMRYQILKDFDEVRIVNLHGDINEKSSNGKKTKTNIFDIKQPVCITFFIKNSTKKENLGKVFYTELIGLKKEEKLKILEKMEYEKLDWQELEPADNYYFFVPKDFSYSEEYDNFVSVKKMFEVFGSGITTDRDELFIDFDEQKLSTRIQKVYNKNYNEDFEKKYKIKDSSSFKLTKRLAETKFNQTYIKEVNYRPFDVRKIYYNTKVISRPAWEVNQHFFQPNLGLNLMRSLQQNFFDTILVSKNTIDRNFFRFQTYTFPLFRYESWLDENKETIIDENEETIKLTTSNFKSGILDKFGFISDLDLFYYIYAILHLPNYRQKYREQLKIDFPKIPIPEQLEKLGISKSKLELVKFGQNLTNLHLLGQNPLDQNSASFFKSLRAQNSTKFFGDNLKIEKINPDTKEQKLWINNSSYFSPVEEKVWQYEIGGYTILEKYLKSRKNRENSELTLEEIKHIIEIICCLGETIELLNS